MERGWSQWIGELIVPLLHVLPEGYGRSQPEVRIDLLYQVFLLPHPKGAPLIRTE